MTMDYYKRKSQMKELVYAMATRERFTSKDIALHVSLTLFLSKLTVLKYLDDLKERRIIDFKAITSNDNDLDDDRYIVRFYKEKKEEKENDSQETNID